ncbi:MAG: metallophosphoesterase [bacterium]
MRTINVYLFISIAFAIYFLVHLYIFLSLKNGLSTSRSYSMYLAAGLLLLSLIYPWAVFTGRPATLIYIGSIWLGVMAISFSMLILKDFATCFVPTVREYLTYAALLMACILCIYSYINEGTVKVHEIEIPVNKDVAGLKGMIFVQLSDLHLDTIKDEKWIDAVVKQVNALSPDFIVITGDLVDGRAIFHKEKAEILKKLKSKYGVFGCLGNHEYYAGKDQAISFIRDANIDLLVNSGKTIANKIYIAGIDDSQGLRFGSEGPNFKKALTGADASKYVILLAHKPDYPNFKEAVSLGTDLMLSGHTHAGQIPPIDLIVYLFYRHGNGLYFEGDHVGYTSSGTGSWGPPMRFLNSSEIVKFTFK